MREYEIRLTIPHDAPPEEEARLDRMFEGFAGFVESIAHHHDGQLNAVARYKKKKAPPTPDERTS